MIGLLAVFVLATGYLSCYLLRHLVVYLQKKYLSACSALRIGLLVDVV